MGTLNMATADERLIYEAYKSPPKVTEEEAPDVPDTQVLEGVHCTCDVCEHYVAGDRCGAPEGISLSKIPSEDYGAVVICETFTAKSEKPEPHQVYTPDTGPLPGEGYGLHGQRPRMNPDPWSSSKF